jgi:electron transfer flavoprotein beta subunit
MQVEVGDGRVRVKRELEGGWFQWVGLPLPSVLTIQSGINQLRYATLKGIMAARKKEIQVVPPPGAGPSGQRLVALSVPERARKVQMIEGAPDDAARELVRTLRDQGLLN